MLPVFYINLAKSTERRKDMEARLAAIGIAGERIEAVTPKDISRELVSRFCEPSPLTLQWVTPQELACTMSHRKAWNIVVDRNLDGALVLEDDALLSSRLPAVLSTIDLDKVDVVHFETRLVPVTIEAGTGSKRIFTNHAGTAAYLVTRAGASKLLEGRRFEFPVDGFMFDPRGPMFNRLAINQMVPAPCIAADVAGRQESSDIGDRSEKVRMQERRRRLPHAMARRLLLRLREEVRERAALRSGAVRGVIPFEA